MICLHLLLLNLLFIHAQARSANITFDEQQQTLLSRIINATLSLNRLSYNDPPARDILDGQSTQQGVCDMFPATRDRNRAACCLIDDGGILFNVKVGETSKVQERMKVEDSSAIHGIGLFRQPPAASAADTNISKISFEKQFISKSFRRIPRIGLGSPRKSAFPTFSIVGSRMSEGSCPGGIFKGTLHVTGQKTLHVVYHTVVDNYAPIVSQILMDAHANSRFLHLPRMGVLLPPPSLFFSKFSKVSKHIKLIKQLFSGGMYTSLEAVASMCFERVIWGWGVNSVYYQYLPAMRRLVGDFARLHLKHFYQPPVPPAFAATVFSDSEQAKVQVHQKKLNIVYFTRGNSSEGRSMAREELIAQAFVSSGWANVHLCCDYNKPNSFQEQLALAYHADVVIGLHGAGLTHALFTRRGSTVVELKTEYAYESVLFNMIADARVGTHAELSVTSYMRRGGHLPVDSRLVEAVIHVTQLATQLTATSATNKFMFSKLENSRTRKKIGRNWLETRPSANLHGLPYALNGPMNASEVTGMAHLLGPEQQQAHKICMNHALHKYEEYVREDRGKGDRADYPQCQICTKYFN